MRCSKTKAATRGSSVSAGGAGEVARDAGGGVGDKGGDGGVAQPAAISANAIANANASVVAFDAGSFLSELTDPGA